MANWIWEEMNKIKNNKNNLDDIKLEERQAIWRKYRK
jgi:hypothetical protein